MISRRIGSCVVVLVLGMLILALPVRAGSVHTPCSMISVGETEALTGDRVVKSVESATVCQRWLAGGHVLSLLVGPQAIKSHETPSAVRQMGGTWVRKQFGEMTCTSVVISSNPRANSMTCSVDREPLFYADGFDNATEVSKALMSFALRVTGPRMGAMLIEHVYALVAKVFARLP